MAPPSIPCNESKPAVPLPSSQAPSIPTNVKGKDLFDSVLWKDPRSTSVFYTFIASLRKRIREEVKQTTPTHRFIRTLRDSKRLVRCYTQNIDGLETREGLCTDLSRGKGVRNRFTKKSLALPKASTGQSLGGEQDGGCEVVQLHGDLETLRCTFCQKTCGWEEGGREAVLLSGEAPECFSCMLQDQDRRDRGKRGTKIGVLRPNIVLYGEEHPSADAVSSITTHDLGFAPDVLLVIGTSLHVHGLKILIKEFAKSVHARAGGKGRVIFVNHTKPPESVWKNTMDYWVCMDCDEWIGSLKSHRPDLWHIQSELKPKVTKAGVQLPKLVSIKAGMSEFDAEKENAGSRLATPSKTTRKATSNFTSRRMPLSETLKMPPQPVISPSSIGLAEKSLKRKRSLTVEQLPTPPSTGHTARFWEESREVPDSEEDVPKTPSKRLKPEVVIFQDPSPKRPRLEAFRQSWKIERTPLLDAQARKIKDSEAIGAIKGKEHVRKKLVGQI